MKPIHFCFLTGAYNRDDALMYFRQGRSLASKGFHVSYVLCDGLPDECRDGIYMTSTDYIPTNRIEKFFGTGKRVLKKALEIDADVYQISDPGLVGIVKALRKKSKRVIVNVREPYFAYIHNKYYIPRYLRHVVALCFDHLLIKALKSCDAVITVNEEICNDLLKKGVSSAVVIANFPFVDKDYCLEYEDYCKRGDVLCYEGTIYKTSRQEVFFDALQELPDIKYLLAGVIEDNNEEIMSHPYWKKVEFIGRFKPTDLPSIFSRSSISNVTRDLYGKDGSTGFIKVYESMEAALPVLLPDAPMYRKMLEKYQCGICVNPNDKKAIYEALYYLTTHKNEAYKMGQEGRRAVLQEYSWDREFEKYLVIIQNVVNKS